MVDAEEKGPTATLQLVNLYSKVWSYSDSNDRAYPLCLFFIPPKSPAGYARRGFPYGVYMVKFKVGDIIRYATWDTNFVFKIDIVDGDYVYGILMKNNHPSHKDVFRITPIEIKYWTLVNKSNPYKNGKLESGGNL